ncbi:MAG: hypothetical protein LJE70_12600 [Chromatiaceae bacterium]|nr:hypothetical protein [Chromatiaceae bacterium]
MSSSASESRNFERHKLRELTCRGWGVSVDYGLKKLPQRVRGCMGYFGISDVYRPNPELDSWIRQRVRMCFRKK